MTARLRVGCSSWTSGAWWGKVYPTGLAPGDRLAAYARRFDAVEVDTSYYRAPAASLVRRWARSTPDDFAFTMKFPRDLLDPKRPVDREAIGAFERHARELGSKLGALLLQFPPWVKPGRVSRYLEELFSSLDPALRYAVELRDAGWFGGEHRHDVLRELGARRIALAWSYLTYVDVPPERTTDFVYLRFIGDHTTVPAAVHGELRVDRSAESALWADRLRDRLPELRAAYVYFNNHFAGFAPASASRFREELGLPPVDWTVPVPHGRQERLD